jgi:NADPH:quinone reductase-like Zn-dependent oxidoreductase
MSYSADGARSGTASPLGERLPDEFKADIAALFALLRDGAIHPVVIDRLPLAAAPEVHTRIDAGGLGGKIVLTPWSPTLGDNAAALTADAPAPN